MTPICRNYILGAIMLHVTMFLKAAGSVFIIGLSSEV